MISTETLAITYGLSSALSWGAGDFSGGMATRQSHVMTVVFYSQLVGIVLLAVLATGFGEAVPPVPMLIWGGVGGICGVLGLVAFYQGLATGRMGIVAPLSAILTALLPVAVTLATDGAPRPLQVGGFGLALVAVWLLSASGERGGLNRRELRLSMIAGLGFGLFFVCIGKAADTAVFWPLVSARAFSIPLVFGILASKRRLAPPAPQVWPAVIATGILDAAGNLFYALAVNTGRMDVSAVLASLYPAATVLLAWMVLKERLGRGQWIGVAAALGALALIAS
jgi:drug/metabolite transporter (DMT)-like permease